MAFDALIDADRDTVLSKDQRDILVAQGQRWDVIRESLLRADREDLKRLRQVLGDHIAVLVDKLRLVITSDIRAPASVAIKLLTRSGEGILVSTFARDTVSREPRDGAPDAFPWQSNTAFADIVNGIARDGYFVCDNLEALAARGLYKNINPNWTKYYNATAVSTIPAEEYANRGLAGFICVDSPYGVLEGDRVRRALAIASTHVYNVLGLMVFEHFSEFERIIEHGQKHFAIGWIREQNSPSVLVEVDPGRQRTLQSVLEAQRVRAITRAADAAEGTVWPPSETGGPPLSQSIKWNKAPEWFPESDPESSAYSKPIRNKLSESATRAFLEEEARADPVLARAIRRAPS
jgi:hypothetical protein